MQPGLAVWYIFLMATFFNDHFGIDPRILEQHEAFNISLVTDLPLFIDPFLLFNSKKQVYRDLHEGIIKYLVFLRDKARASQVHEGLLRAWYCFPEVKQTWLGFSLFGNEGHGLGLNFAHALHGSLHTIFAEFGSEKITKSSHLEKVCLIRDGVGRDNISDFTTNLIKGFLCDYTQGFALAHLNDRQRRTVSIAGASFNYETEVWVPTSYTLPWINGDYVVLTPRDLLTRDENWINRDDLIENLERIPAAISDTELRAQVNNYFHQALFQLRDREPTKKERTVAAIQTLQKFPALIDYYIRDKENRGPEASARSFEKVRFSEAIFISQLRSLQGILSKTTQFYATAGDTYNEAHARLAYLKDVIENKGGFQAFYKDGVPLEREHDLKVMYRLVWLGSPSDVSMEVNDGRGPADFKISRGARDKTIVELKLAKNSHLKRNLQKQAEIYQRASDAQNKIKAIIFFTEHEEVRLRALLKEMELASNRDVVLIDARNDNKPSGSKAR